MKKTKFNLVKFDFSKAKNEGDINNIIQSSLNLSNEEFDGSLDKLFKKVDDLPENLRIQIQNPEIEDGYLIRYVNIIKNIFYGRDILTDYNTFYMHDIFKKVFFIFIFYSFIGWIVENFVEIVIKGWTYMPREFLRGPLCPIFGIGAIILLILLDKPLKNNQLTLWQKIVSVFVGSTIITSALEFLTSFYLEATTGTWPWKGYINQPFNLGGRIALENSLGFGLIATISLLFIQPKVEKCMKDMKYGNIFRGILSALIILFVLDIVFAMLIPTGVRLDIQRISWR